MKGISVLDICAWHIGKTIKGDAWTITSTRSFEVTKLDVADVLRAVALRRAIFCKVGTTPIITNTSHFCVIKVVWDATHQKTLMLVR